MNGPGLVKIASIVFVITVISGCNGAEEILSELGREETVVTTPTPAVTPISIVTAMPTVTPVATATPTPSITPPSVLTPVPIVTPSPVAIIGDIMNGQALYTEQGCTACHDIAFNERNVWVGTEASVISDSIANEGLMASYRSDDQSNGTVFTDQELLDLAAYIEFAQEGTVTTATDIPICDAEIAVRRSKNILTGLSPTAEETTEVFVDTDSLKGLVEGWLETDEFRSKMMDFFTKTLQQTSIVQDDYAAQMLSADLADRWLIHDAFMVSMNESMARTALWLIDTDQPFSDIAAGRTWMMTTQMMAYLAAIENSGDRDNLTFYHNDTTLNGIAFNANTPHDVQIENKMFYSPQALDWVGNGFDCTSDPQVFNNSRRDRLFAAFMSNGNKFVCDDDIKPEVYTTVSDSVDWRPVTMMRGEPADWWNALAFRDATELVLRTSRTGFFSHPAFLATWRSNEDNDFRVTTNQALIAGLGRAFEETDTSIPLGDEGLSDDHASPDTDCYSCHKTLDPMRTFYDVDFDPVYYGANPDQAPPAYDPSFSFLGLSGEGSDLEDFGRYIGEHPYFATGWVQKMCAYANGEECDTNTAEFARVLAVFEGSNLNFKTMVTELFSSSLVTNTSCANPEDEQAIPVSLTRLDHFCPTLAARTGINDICSLNSTTILSGALPTDSWSRGADNADQATDPGMFYRATIESLCSEVSNELVDDGSFIRTSDIEGSIDWLVEGFMGVSQSDSRFADVRAALQGHYDDIREVNTTNRLRLESVATLACVSPFLTSTDF